MWPNPTFPADLVTFTGEMLDGKLHFLCNGCSLLLVLALLTWSLFVLWLSWLFEYLLAFEIFKIWTWPYTEFLTSCFLFSNCFYLVTVSTVSTSGCCLWKSQIVWNIQSGRKSKDCKNRNIFTNTSVVKVCFLPRISKSFPKWDVFSIFCKTGSNSQTILPFWTWWKGIRFLFCQSLFRNFLLGPFQWAQTKVFQWIMRQKKC